MNKDFKIGLAMGLCLIAAVSFWLAVQPSLSVKARMVVEQTIDQQSAPSQPSVTPSQPFPQPAADSTQSKYRIHLVQRGETLSAISKRYYGAANRWQKILDANRSTLKTPESLAPGMKLIIPD